MGVRNYLVEGVSATGKTSVCRELQRRGFSAVNGDTELAYQGDPETGERLPGASHEHHIWDVDLFDRVFVLEVDVETLTRRLDDRPEDEWGGRPAERELVLRLHRTHEDVPRDATVIDATAPLADVVDEILRHVASDAPA